MLRDLAAVIADLHAGLHAAAARAGVRITHAETTLPIDAALSLQGGGCVLLADVKRSSADVDWLGQPCRMSLTWHETPTENLS